MIVAEALDRNSRDQEDIANFYKRAEFAGVKIYTLAEGESPAADTGAQPQE